MGLKADLGFDITMNQILTPQESKGNGYLLALLFIQVYPAHQAAPESVWLLSHPIPQTLGEAKTPSAHRPNPEVDIPKKVSCPSS
jgi:hypothetical protein